MAKTVNDIVLDAMLEYVADNGMRLCVCSAEPTTYTEAITTYMLADEDLTVGIAGPDYATADGDTNGRKLTVSQQADILIDSSGDATHIALVDVTGTTLLVVTSCTTQALTSGNTVTVPAWDQEIADPT